VSAGVLSAVLVTVGRFVAEKEDETVVSPGLAGFLVTFALALATVFLIRSMVKHLRRVRYGPGPDAGDPQAHEPGSKQGPGAKQGPASKNGPGAG
jgi:hypothetical protein